jgi:hypothetical protein
MKTFPDFHKSRGTILPATIATDDDEKTARPYLLGGLPFIGAAAAAEPLIGPKITWWLSEWVHGHGNPSTPFRFPFPG